MQGSYNYKIQPFENTTNSLWTVKNQTTDSIWPMGPSLLKLEKGRDCKQIILKPLFYKSGCVFPILLKYKTEPKVHLADFWKQHFVQLDPTLHDPADLRTIGKKHQGHTVLSFYNQNTHHCTWGTVIFLLREENGDQELFKWWYTDVLKQSPLCKVKNTGKLRFFNMTSLVSKQLSAWYNMKQRHPLALIFPE